MPTNDERREVARRLRYVAEHGAPEWATTACCIAECIGEDDYPLWNGSGLLFSKLADLIEPQREPTCRISATGIVDSLGQNMYRCSECGALMEDDAIFFEGVDEIDWFKYCPNCGAKVVPNE